MTSIVTYWVLYIQKVCIFLWKLSCYNKESTDKFNHANPTNFILSMIPKEKNSRPNTLKVW